MPLTPTVVTILEKTALDSGFDVDLGREGDWLRYGSSHSQMTLGLGALGDSLFLVSFSQHNVLKAVADVGTSFTNPLPSGAVGARAVSSLDALHNLVKRALVLSRTLPDELLHRFEAETARLPRSTEAERLVIQRVGQDVFRAGLMDYWEGRCAVTGLAIPELLRASHIKPWADCETDAQRLDVFNGLLLAAHLDAAFDAGLITFSDDGAMITSSRLSEQVRDLLGLTESSRLTRLTDAHRTYLAWHRGGVFRLGDDTAGQARSSIR